MCLWLYGEREGFCLHMYPHSLIKIFAVNLQNQLGLALVAQLDARLTCDQDVAGSFPPPPPPPPPSSPTAFLRAAFVEYGHEIFSSHYLPSANSRSQEGQLSVSCNRMCTRTG